MAVPEGPGGLRQQPVQGVLACREPRGNAWPGLWPPSLAQQIGKLFKQETCHRFTVLRQRRRCGERHRPVRTRTAPVHTGLARIALVRTSSGRRLARGVAFEPRSQATRHGEVPVRDDIHLQARETSVLELSPDLLGREGRRQ